MLLNFLDKECFIIENNEVIKSTLYEHAEGCFTEDSEPRYYVDKVTKELNPDTGLEENCSKWAIFVIHEWDNIPHMFVPLYDTQAEAETECKDMILDRVCCNSKYNIYLSEKDALNDLEEWD